MMGSFSRASGHTHRVDLQQVLLRFAECRPAEHMEDGRPAAEKRITGGTSPALALRPRAGTAGCACEQLVTRDGKVISMISHLLS